MSKASIELPDEVKEEINALVQENEELFSTGNKLSAKIKELNLEIEKQKEEVAKLVSENQKMSQELEEAKMDASTASHAIATATSTIEQLYKNQDDHLKHMEILRDQVQTLQSENESLKSTLAINQKRESEAQSKEQSIDHIRSTILEMELRKAQAMGMDLQSKIQENKTENDKVIKEKEKQEVRLQVASALGRAVGGALAAFSILDKSSEKGSDEKTKQGDDLGNGTTDNQVRSSGVDNDSAQVLEVKLKQVQLEKDKIVLEIQDTVKLQKIQLQQCRNELFRTEESLAMAKTEITRLETEKRDATAEMERMKQEIRGAQVEIKAAFVQAREVAKSLLVDDAEKQSLKARIDELTCVESANAGSRRDYVSHDSVATDKALVEAKAAEARALRALQSKMDDEEETKQQLKMLQKQVEDLKLDKQRLEKLLFAEVFDIGKESSTTVTTMTKVKSGKEGLTKTWNVKEWKLVE